MQNATKPILTISIMTSDRLDTIPRCLDSLNELREAVASELIITDTSKNPKVREVIEKYTDLIEEFEWCNDFAKARNVGLKKARGEWFMFIDDDEWFIDSKPLIKFFSNGDYKKYVSANYKIRNYKDVKLNSYVDVWVERLVKIGETTRFSSRVHEYLIKERGQQKVIDALVGHSGYAFQSEEDKIKHYERNLSLLEKMEVEEPQNFRWKILQIQEFFSICDWNRMAEYCKRIIDSIEEKKTVKESVLSQIYVGCVWALEKNKNYEEAKIYYLQGRDILRSNMMLNAHMDIAMSEVYYRLGEYDSLYEHVTNYEKAFTKYQCNPKKYVNEEMGNIFIYAFTEQTHRAMSSLILYGKLQKGIYEDIDRLYAQLNFEGPNQLLLYKIHIKLFEVLISLEDYSMLKTVVKNSIELGDIRNSIISTIAEWEYRGNTSFETLSDIIKEIDLWTWYKLFGRVFELESNNIKNMYQTAKLFIKSVPNVFQVPSTIRDVLRQHDIEIETLYMELDFMEWKNQLVEHMNCINIKQLDELKESLENSSLNEDIRFIYFMMLYSEQKLIQNIKSDLHVEEYSDMLAAFSTYTCRTYESLYAEEIQNMELEDLPNNYQAALWLKLYFEEMENDFKIALTCLSNVVQVYPFLSEVIKHYLYLIETEVLNG